MIFTVVLILLTWLIWRYPLNGLSRIHLLAGWGIKVMFGIAFMYIHTKIYGVGDITVDWEEYMDDSVTLNNVAFQDFGAYLRFLFGFNSEAEVQHYLAHTNHWSAGDLTIMNDSRNVLRINSLLVFISRGNVYVHVLFFSFFSFIGFREAYRAFYNQVYLSNTWFWYGLILLPSVGFWTSSVLKEPLMLLGLSLILHGLFGELNRKQKTVRLVGGAILMLGFKPYVFLCLLAAVLIWLLVKWSKYMWLLASAIILLITSVIGVIEPVKNEITHHLTRKQFDFINVGKGGVHVFADSCFYFFPVETYDKIEINEQSEVRVLKPVVAKKVTFGMAYPFEDIRLEPSDAHWTLVFKGSKCGSYVEVTPIGNSYAQLVKNIPEAMVNAGLRPYFWDPGGKIKWFNALETLGLFTFLGYGIFRFRRHYSRKQKEIILVLTIFALAMLVLIGWTTPILGAIVRYRMPVYFVVAILGALGVKKEYEK
jgi:hypothetical protein